MFGFQRIGDLIWCAGDMRCRGFLIGGTAGRTTLNGEGLQHQDGHSHLLTMPVPNLLTYDPAFAYELAVIILDGIKRMYVNQEDIFYYLTVGNENYAMPAMPYDCRDGILKGLYLFSKSELKNAKLKAQLLGSGPILNEAIKAAKMLENYGVAADVWSLTSHKALRMDGLECDRWNLLHPTEPARVPYITQQLAKTEGVIVAVSDYVKMLPDALRTWMPRPMISLGTEGFGRSETRQNLRDFFEIDARYVTIATLSQLARENKIKPEVVAKAIEDLEIHTDKPNPLSA
jgi:pyruvate dehydrogenase E1 component